MWREMKRISLCGVGWLVGGCKGGAEAETPVIQVFDVIEKKIYFFA
jgi:hypothetical protein